MRKTILLFFVILTFKSNSNAQVIEVIDAIGKNLLPKITESVKSIISDNVSKKQQEKTKEEVEKAILNAKKEMIDKLNSEITNLEDINKLHTITRRLSQSAGALTVLSNSNFVSTLKDVTSTNREVVILFITNLNNIIEDRSKIDNISFSTLNGLLLSNLKTAKESLDDEIGVLKTIFDFTGGKFAYDSEKLDNYIKAISRSNESVSKIALSINSISRTFESYIEVYISSYKNLKTDLSK